MNSHWKELTAEEYCDKVADGTHDTPKPKEIGEYLITSKHITGGKVDLSSAYRISKEDFEKINIRSKVDKWDVLLTMIGTVGEIVLVDHEPNYAIKNIGLFKCGDEIKARWLKYYLLSPDGKAEIQSRLGGTTQEYIALGELRRLPIVFPPPLEQRAIAGVLSSLDDKIDLLHRQNKTLEGMAEALWRKMFVEDADPGWKKRKLGNIVSVSTGKGLKRIEYNENGLYPVIGANGEIGRTDKYLTNEKLILTGRVGTLGGIFISNREVWISDNVLMIKPNEDRVFHAVYFLLKNMDFENLNVGSTQPLVTQTDLKNIEIELPDNDILDYFANWCESGFNKIEKNVSQIRTISRLRDTLLPKLMSGEVRVKL